MYTAKIQLYIIINNIIYICINYYYYGVLTFYNNETEDALKHIDQNYPYKKKEIYIII